MVKVVRLLRVRIWWCLLIFMIDFFRFLLFYFMGWSWLGWCIGWDRGWWCWWCWVGCLGLGWGNSWMRWCLFWGFFGCLWRWFSVLVRCYGGWGGWVLLMFGDCFGWRLVLVWWCWLVSLVLVVSWLNDGWWLVFCLLWWIVCWS